MARLGPVMHNNIIMHNIIYYVYVRIIHIMYYVCVLYIQYG